MARITITVEDREDGAVMVTSETDMGPLVHRAANDDDLSGAEWMAASAWVALHQAAQEVVAERGGDVVSSDDVRTLN